MRSNQSRCNSEEEVTSHCSLLTSSPIALQFACNPSGIAFRGSDDRCRDDFRYLVRVERANAGFKPGIRIGTGLEQAIPLGGPLCRSLPAVHTRNGAEYLGTRRKPFGDYRLGDATCQLLRRNCGGDLKQRRQDGTLVSSPVLPSSMGTMAVRQPLLNVTVRRCPSGSGVMSTMSAPNLLRA